MTRSSYRTGCGKPINSLTCRPADPEEAFAQLEERQRKEEEKRGPSGREEQYLEQPVGEEFMKIVEKTRLEKLTSYRDPYPCLWLRKFLIRTRM